MELTIDRPDGGNDVVVVAVVGELDASSYLGLIDAGRQLVGEGVRNLLVDLTDLTYLGSSGLVALHSLALLVAGREPPDPEAGWSAFHGLSLDVAEAGEGGRIKLLNPQPQVDRTLERTGMKRLFEVHTDRAAALASF
jgi:anti-anti-sigma regulatory factor